MKRNKIIMGAIVLIFTLIITGCNSIKEIEHDENGNVSLYYIVEISEDGSVGYDAIKTSMDINSLSHEELILKALDMLKSTPKDRNVNTYITKDIAFKSASINENTLTLKINGRSMQDTLAEGDFMGQIIFTLTALKDNGSIDKFNAIEFIFNGDVENSLIANIFDPVVPDGPILEGLEDIDETTEIKEEIVEDIDEEIEEDIED